MSMATATSQLNYMYTQHLCRFHHHHYDGVWRMSTAAPDQSWLSTIVVHYYCYY